MSAVSAITSWYLWQGFLFAIMCAPRLYRLRSYYKDTTSIRVTHLQVISFLVEVWILWLPWTIMDKIKK